MGTPPLVGQVTTSGSAQVLTATVVTPSYWILKAPSSNAAAIFFGPASVTTATGFQLDPGDAMEFDRRPDIGGVFDLVPSDVYVVGSGGVATWLAFR